MIYLDNASTTNKKPFCVKWAVFKALSKKYCANPGRSSHKYSLNAEKIVFDTRELANDFFGNNCVQNVVFTSGCTEALNFAILGTAKQGGNVVYCTNAHNSVARPLCQLESKNIISTTLIKANKLGIVEPKDVENAISSKTYLVVINHTSNVTGATTNIEQIGKICKKHNVMFLVDAAQSAGHQKIDMQKCGISMLAVAGHKGLLAGQGIGMLLFDKNVKIVPQKFGGTGTHSEQLLPPISYPESLEAGTPATPLIFGLNAGIKYVQKNFDKINNKIACLTNFLLDELEKIKGVVLFTPPHCHNGVVSFVVEGTSTSDVVEFFNSNKICIRSGLHCAPLCHKNLGTINGGTVRVSISNFNTKRQIKKFCELLKKFVSLTKNQ